MIEEIEIRKAKVEDASALLAIYAPYVKNTAVTFEYDVPTALEFADRIAAISEKFPYLVAVSGGEMLGYAYAAEFKDRAAYQWSVETSVYVREDCRRGHVGEKLYEELKKRLQDQGILNMNACIAYPCQVCDPYLTCDSVAFHRSMGFDIVAHFHKCGKKFGRWYDMVWMELHIGEHL